VSIGTADLSRGEAWRRAAATTALAAIALVQAIALPALLIGPARFVVLSVAAMALCVVVSLALATAPASASREVWRAVAVTAALVLAGWAVPHEVALPGLGTARGDWSATAGAACAAPAAVGLVLAGATLRPTRATARGLATAVAVALALAPGVGGLLVALGPGPTGGEAAITADVHVHAHSTAPEPDIRLRPGRNGNHYVTPVAARPHVPAFGIALVVAAAFVFVCGAFGSLCDRSAPPRPGLERGLA
jgi:hypothetical protein